MDEKRTLRRRRVLKTGRIILAGHRSELDCAVHDLTEDGASLEVASPIGIPDRFDLMVGDERTPRPCHVRWRSARRIGVDFD